MSAQSIKNHHVFVPVVRWLQSHDRGYLALRRAARTAIVMPCVFVFSLKVIDNATVALFAAIGVLAQLMLVGYVGTMRSRLEAQAALGIAGAVLITLATLCSQRVWLAALAMAVVAFVVVFLGVVSSVLASSATALLLAFILPVATPAPASQIADRLFGWGLSSGAAFLAVWFLWPSPELSPLRGNLASACRALADRLSSIGESVTAEDSSSASDDVASLGKIFLATPWRPSGLGASDRAIIRIVDEIAWLNIVVEELVALQASHPAREFSRAVQASAAAVLNEASTLLSSHSTSTAGILAARSALSQDIEDLERHLEGHLLIGDSSTPTSAPLTKDAAADEFVSSLEFSFRSREVGFAAVMIATNVERAVVAEQRSFVERVLGHEPGGTRLWSSARSRITSRLKRHSIWLHNSVRGAIGLGIAVAVAEELSVEHSFWVILGTLSVLRSNALSTGQNAVRAIGGTLIGFVVGAAIVVLVGTNSIVLWFLLPVALFVAAFAPTAISFVVGQAGFTLLIVILFNILAPVGWHVGLVRSEDVAIGCAVSAGVSLLIWPRGASAELGAAIRASYVQAVAYLAKAANGVDSRVGDVAEAAPEAAEEAAGAARRLDDALRNYLGERGAKPVPLGDIATLVTGVSILRLSADAVIDLWEHDHKDDETWRASRDRLDALAAMVRQWYDDFADRFESPATFRDVSVQEVTDHPVAEAVHDELVRSVQPDLASAVRILWTADHLNVAQRLESVLTNAATASEGLWVERRLLPRREVVSTSTTE
jgi:uncharacterized membrane protein YccC